MSESPRRRSCPWSNTFNLNSRNINGKIKIKDQNFYPQIFAISTILKKYHKSAPMKTIRMWIYQMWCITQDYLFTELKLTLVSSWGLHRCFCVKHWWASWWWRARWRSGSATTPEEGEKSWKPVQNNKNISKGVHGSVFLPTYREALCDGNLYIEEKDSGSESCTDSNGLLGIAEHTAHTAGNQT